MKYLALLFLAVPAVACQPGSIEVSKGICAADLKPEGAPTAAPTTDPKIVSDEKPSHHPEPAWQRGEVVAATPQSEIANDIKKDNDKKCAEIQGKKKSHLPLTEDEKTIAETVCKQ